MFSRLKDVSCCIDQSLEHVVESALHSIAVTMHDIDVALLGSTLAPFDSHARSERHAPTAAVRRARNINRCSVCYNVTVVSSRMSREDAPTLMAKEPAR